MLLLLTMTGAILLSSLSAFLYKQYSEKSIRDTYGVAVEQLDQTYRMIEAQLTTVYNYYAGFYSSSDVVFNALYADRFDSEEMFEIHKALADSMQASPLVSSVYVVNRGADAVFSTDTTVRTIEEFYDSDMISYLREEHRVNDPILLPRETSYRIYDKREEHAYLSILFTEAANTADIDSALIVNVSQDKIREILAIKPSDGRSRKMIVDREGRVVIRTDGREREDSIANDSFFRSIAADEARSGYFTADVQGRKALITHIESGSALGWYFISVMDYEMLVARITQLRGTVFMITGIFVVLSAVLSLFFIRSLYRPVHRLIRKIKSAGKLENDASSHGEFEFLRDAFDRMTANISGLSQTVHTYKPAKKKELLERLIRDEIRVNPNTEEELQMVGIPPDSAYNRIVAIRLDGYAGLKDRCSQRDIALYRYAIANIAGELLEGLDYVEEIISKEDSIVLLIGSIGGTPLPNLAETFGRIREAVGTILKLSVTTAIGSEFSRISDIRKSYYGALSASTYRLRLGRGAIIDQESFQHQVSLPYEYPHDLEKRLLNSLRLEDRDKFDRSLDAFAQAANRFAYDEAILSFTQLALAVVKTATGEMQVDPEQLGLQRQNIPRQLTERDTLEEIKLWFGRIYASIAQAAGERKDSRQAEMIKQLADYISVHYRDPNLSVESLADQVRLSPNHLRLIFKNHFGKSLSEYITDIRFEHAKRLLRETDKRIKDIAEEVGFANTGYFYTNFKKYTGVSAAQFREACKAEPDS